MGELDSVLGTLLIGTWGATGLFALELVWGWRYYYSFPKDAIFLKLIVFMTMFSDCVALAAACASNYLYCITHWGDVLYLQNQFWPVPIYIGATAFTAAIVQGFLIYRFIQLAGKNWYVMSILVLPSVACFVASWMTAGMVLKYRALDQRILLNAPINVWFVAGAGADVSIALALAWQLYRRRQAGLHRTNTVLRRLITISLQSGSITAVFALATLISYLIQPASNVSTVMEWYMCRLYALTLLYSLNSRKRLWASDQIPGGDRPSSLVTVGRGPIRFMPNDLETSDDYSLSTSQALSRTTVRVDDCLNCDCAMAEQESNKLDLTDSTQITQS